MDDVLKSGYCETNLDYDNVDLFVDSVIRLENKMAFCFKNSNKHIITTEEDEEGIRNNNICHFCGKNFESDKVRYHCHLTSKDRGPAQTKRKINVTQKQTKIYTFHISLF